MGMNKFRHDIAAVILSRDFFREGEEKKYVWVHVRVLHASANCERVRIIAIKSWCIARRVLDGYIANCQVLSNDQVHVIPS